MTGPNDTRNKLLLEQFILKLENLRTVNVWRIHGYKPINTNFILVKILLLTTLIDYKNITADVNLSMSVSWVACSQIFFRVSTWYFSAARRSFLLLADVFSRPV